ncbi:MAG: hypothetical protein J4432_05135 [DPANN group archaeon]|nr:hypothetical protein [DPANN group archaeon]
MEPITEKLIDELLKELVFYIEQNNTTELRELSNRIIERALVFEDSRLIDISLTAYALSKLLSKPHIMDQKGFKKLKVQLIKLIEKEVKEEQTILHMEHILEKVMKLISEYDDKEGNYLQDVIEKARLKQASRAYALGLSLRRAAELTRVNTAALLPYVGQTKIHDRPYTQSKGLKARYQSLKKVMQ